MGSETRTETDPGALTLGVVTGVSGISSSSPAKGHPHVHPRLTKVNHIWICTRPTISSPSPRTLHPNQAENPREPRACFPATPPPRRATSHILSIKAKPGDSGAIHPPSLDAWHLPRKHSRACIMIGLPISFRRKAGSGSAGPVLHEPEHDWGS